MSVINDALAFLNERKGRYFMVGVVDDATDAIALNAGGILVPVADRLDLVDKDTIKPEYVARTYYLMHSDNQHAVGWVTIPEEGRVIFTGESVTIATAGYDLLLTAI